jgi:hypothetical protein
MATELNYENVQHLSCAVLEAEEVSDGNRAKKKELTGLARQLSNRSPWRINASDRDRASDARKTRDGPDTHTNPGLSRPRNTGRTEHSTDTGIHTHSPLERLLRSPLKRPR